MIPSITMMIMRTGAVPNIESSPIPIRAPASIGPKNLQVVSRAVASNNIDADFLVCGRLVVWLASSEGRGDDFIWVHYTKTNRGCTGHGIETIVKVPLERKV
jgi:hypothetical protein